MPHSLHEFMNKLNRATSHEEMLSGVMDSAVHQLHLSACAISLKKGAQFKVKISRGYSSHFQRHYVPRIEDPPFSRLPGCNEGLLYTDGGPFPEKKGDQLFLFPLQFRGACLGFSAIARSAPFTEEEIMTFENLSILAAFILHDEILEERLRHNSIFDETTGAYNAFYFKLKVNDALGYLERYGHGFAVLGLKYHSSVSLKRLYGSHRVARSLRLLTGKVRAVIRDIDTPARFEESTFLILLRSPQESTAASLAERIVAAVEEGLKEAGIEARMDYALLFIEEKTSYRKIIQSLEEALDESERTRGLVIAYP